MPLLDIIAETALENSLIPPRLIFLILTVVGMTAFTAIAFNWFSSRSEEESASSRIERKNTFDELDKISNESGTITPPLPPVLIRILSRCSLCQLATVDAEGCPHLSLMRFTFHPKTNKIIMTTRRKTRKFRNLTNNKNVSAVFHDFPNVGEDNTKPITGTFSITTKGVLEVSPSGTEEESFYRDLHRKNNPGYDQFIVGEGIAVLLIDVISASVCNIRDEVTHWSKKGDSEWVSSRSGTSN
eukprot:g2292.t1